MMTAISLLSKKGVYRVCQAAVVAVAVAVAAAVVAAAVVAAAVAIVAWDITVPMSFYLM